MQLRFDIANFVATENLPFTKYTRICALEAHHGVQLGPSYISENAGKEMIHYIAETRKQDLKQKLTKAKFFSLLLDGSTLIMKLSIAVWCDPECGDEKVHTQMQYFTIVQPHFVTASGLLQVLESGLHCLGINELSSESCKRLVGIGTDGASANIAAHSLKVLLKGSFHGSFRCSALCIS